MSKYGELNAAFESYGERFLLYRDECCSLAHLLLQGLNAYFSCTKQEIGFVDKDGNSPRLMNALYLENGDPSWRLNMWIVFSANLPTSTALSSERGYSISNHYSFCILIRKSDADFLLKLKGFAEEFSVSRDVLEVFDHSKFYKFYDFVFSTIQNYYDNKFDRLLSEGVDASDVGIDLPLPT